MNNFLVLLISITVSLFATSSYAQNTNENLVLDSTISITEAITNEVVQDENMQASVEEDIRIDLKEKI
jgi:low affinity Fe/Cu permease